MSAPPSLPLAPHTNRCGLRNDAERLRNLELHQLEVRSGNAFADVENFDSNNLILVIEIENDA
jgi:hypothetical protein